MNAPTRNDPAAFRAAYSDWKLIRSRKVVQIVLEVPLEEADRAYAALGGMPRPDAEVWCGVARLTPGKEVMPTGPAIRTATPTERDPAPLTDGPTPSAGARKPVATDKRLTQQAAIACTEPKFWAFIRERHETPCCSEDEATDFVRSFCGVSSRKDIVAGTAAAHAWDSLRSDYMAWELVG